ATVGEAARDEKCVDALLPPRRAGPPRHGRERLRGALDYERRQRAQGLGSVAERFERAVTASAEREPRLPGAVEPQYGRIGCLAARAVASLAFAGEVRGRRRVEHVVGDLEREAERLPVRVEGG